MTLEEEVRRLVIDGERATPEAGDLVGHKAALLPQYQLYLSALTRGAAPLLARADDYLRTVRAMRDPEAFADLEAGGRADPAPVDPETAGPLRLLDGYLGRLAATTVLILETGAGSLTLFALRGGVEPLPERVVLERGRKEFVAALVALLQRQRTDIDRLKGGKPITRELYTPIEEAAEAVWAALPAGIRTALEAASTILYLPSAFGDLSEFPLELVRDPGGWLGATRTVARLSSLRTLFELLSPNRTPSRLAPRALIVRARDAEDLSGADPEIDAVRNGLRAMHVAAEVDLAPRIESVRAALDRGMRVLHYCGHGFAGDLGEALPIGPGEMLGPHHFSELSGADTPFVYLSTCAVGRARMTTSGSAAGFSTRLIEKGAPAVVGCLQPVPDHVAQAIATSFYYAAASRPAGEALTFARKEQGLHPPACWGAFALFGDPSLELGATGPAVPRTRGLTLRWDSRVGRHLAVRTPESRELALAGLREARAREGAAADALDRVAGWLGSSFQPAEPELADQRMALCRDIAARDLIAGCELRMLLAMEVLQGSYVGARKADIVVSPEEVLAGLRCAKAIHDTIAWPAFAIECARGGGLGLERSVVFGMLDQAVGMLEGWVLEEPAAGALLATARSLRSDLREA